VLLAALIPGAVSLGGCFGGGSEDGGERVRARLGAPVRLANCRDWNDAPIRERQATIEGIREFAGGPVPGKAAGGRTIPDDKAYDLFENYCRHDFARGFKLYKLYARAAAFSGVRDAR
jgi:hypothetical protein